MIVDIHTHMLYGIDDGAYDKDMSLTLMGMDYDQGVRGIFCTNHSRGMEEGYRDYHRRFDKLWKVAADRYPGLSLYKGCEILCCREKMPGIIANIKKDVYPTMNGTNYVLMEFKPPGTKGMEEMNYCLEYALDHGYVPIIAHAERYKSIYDNPLEDLVRIKEFGCLVQINLYSIEQDRGLVGGGSRKKLANLFLNHQLVDFVGTDTHRLDYKSPETAIGASALRGKYGDEYAEQVLLTNAENLLKTNIYLTNRYTGRKFYNQKMH